MLCYNKRDLLLEGNNGMSLKSWEKVFKNGPIKIRGIHPLKNLK